MPLPIIHSENLTCLAQMPVTADDQNLVRIRRAGGVARPSSSYHPEPAYGGGSITNHLAPAQPRSGRDGGASDLLLRVIHRGQRPGQLLNLLAVEH